VRLSRPFTALAASAAALLVPAGAVAQRQQPTPEQRIDRLERQVNEMHRRVYPKGKPADTAGFSDEPAATQSSVITLDQRLDALERQMTDMLRQSEENGNRLRSMESGLGQLKTDEDQRIQALEQRMTAAEAAPPTPAPAADTTEPAVTSKPATTTKPTPTRPKPKTSPQSPKAAEATPPAGADADAASASPTDPGEDAYSQGFHQWEAGQYDDAISTLKSFVATYPKHKRVSYANNLIGRAQLDKGDARAAATTLLSNYRTDPGGERAPDSLYYLGQALMKLGQPAQACKAYGELDAVYGAKVRPDLKKMETDAKAQANCA
jgi:TolA-binding protein